MKAAWDGAAVLSRDGSARDRAGTAAAVSCYGWTSCPGGCTGTMAYNEAPGAGCLYRLELDGSCTQVLTGLTISNGIGWNPDGTRMYLADSGTGDDYAFDFDADTGNLGHRWTVVHVSPPNVVSDGLTVDYQGRLVERRRAHAVPPGRIAAGYHPAPGRPANIMRVWRCCHGQLFVTTAREGLDDAALTRQADAGRLLRLDSLGLTGAPLSALSRAGGQVRFLFPNSRVHRDWVNGRSWRESLQEHSLGRQPEVPDSDGQLASTAQFSPPPAATCIPCPWWSRS
jgi:SMP-30/Gluconolactonase/LRE-like region